MATPQLNLSISAGVNFSQSFTISNPDNSSTDLSGYTVVARMAKHGGALDALTSTSATPVYSYTSFTTELVNASLGECRISLTGAETAQLPEGKYTYSVVLDNNSGNLTEILHGLVTVRPSIGFTTTLGA